MTKKASDYMNHYKWLEKNLVQFFENCGIKITQGSALGVIGADGDKCYGYANKWENAGIHFFHGVAMYLITKQFPYCHAVRNTENGWVAPVDWVIENYEKFKPLLPPIGE